MHLKIAQDTADAPPPPQKRIYRDLNVRVVIYVNRININDFLEQFHLTLLNLIFHITYYINFS